MRYDRDLMATTVRAMKRVAEIRAKRERQFYKKRMAGNKVHQREDNLREVRKHIELVSAPSVRIKTQVERVAETKIPET
jgi:large subunit ribosomal protein L24e